MHNLVNLIFIFGAKYLYLLAMAIALVWFLKQPRLKKKEILVIACFSLPLIFILSYAASHLYYHPRPFAAGNFKPLIYHQANNGFPSHHMLLVSVIAAIVFIFSRRLGFILWVLAIAVGFSRVYVGLHHLMDIAASVLIVVGSVALVGYLKKHRGGD